MTERRAWSHRRWAAGLSVVGVLAACAFGAAWGWQRAERAWFVENRACTMLAADAVVLVGSPRSVSTGRGGAVEFDALDGWKGPSPGTRMRAEISDDGTGWFRPRQGQLLALMKLRDGRGRINWMALSPPNFGDEIDEIWPGYEREVMAALDRVTAIAASGEFGVGTLNEACAPLLYRTQYEPGSLQRGRQP